MHNAPGNSKHLDHFYLITFIYQFYSNSAGIWSTVEVIKDQSILCSDHASPTFDIVPDTIKPSLLEK